MQPHPPTPTLAVSHYFFLTLFQPCSNTGYSWTTAKSKPALGPLCILSPVPRSLMKCHHLRENIGYHPKEQDSYIFSPLLCLDPFLHVIIYFVLLIPAHFLSLLAQVWLYESKHLACAQPTTLRPQLMAHIQWIITATEDHWRANSGSYSVNNYGHWRSLTC